MRSLVTFDISFAVSLGWKMFLIDGTSFGAKHNLRNSRMTSLIFYPSPLKKLRLSLIGTKACYLVLEVYMNEAYTI